MEIKDILGELIAISTNTINEHGSPENFDLEDFIIVLEKYYDELDEIGEFIFEDNSIEYSDDYNDDYE